MTQSLLRLSFSVVLGAVMALGGLSLVNALQPATAHAQQLDAEDFFGGDGDEFRDNAGLGEADLNQTAAGLIRVALGFLGVIAVVIVMLGGFKWMTASGNDEKVSDAKRLLISGVIGLAIIISAWAITEFVITSLLQASQ